MYLSHSIKSLAICTLTSVIFNACKSTSSDASGLSTEESDSKVQQENPSKLKIILGLYFDEKVKDRLIVNGASIGGPNEKVVLVAVGEKNLEEDSQEEEIVGNFTAGDQIEFIRFTHVRNYKPVGKYSDFTSKDKVNNIGDLDSKLNDITNDSQGHGVLFAGVRSTDGKTFVVKLKFLFRE